MRVDEFRAGCPHEVGGGARYRARLRAPIGRPRSARAWVKWASFDVSKPVVTAPSKSLPKATWSIPATRLTCRIASAIAFLLGPDAAFCCGSVLFVDGGSDALLRPDAL